MGSKVLNTIIIVSLSIFSASCENFLSTPSTQPQIDYTGQIDTIYDIDGNAYKTVGIGSQIWIAQNLKTTRLNDGTIIPQVTADTNWTWYITPGYCWYNNG